MLNNSKPIHFQINFSHTKYMSSNNLLPQYQVNRSNWKPLHPNLIRKYLPKLKRSMWTSQTYVSSLEDSISSDLEKKRYKLFEVSESSGISTIFCGGPVEAMAWMPTPILEPKTSEPKTSKAETSKPKISEPESLCEQILAVSVNLDPNCNVYHTSNESKRDPLESKRKPGMIQFWNFGPLRNNSKITPHLEFCIAHDFGVLYDLEWCPSGCYDLTFPSGDDKQRRLGLLSVASVDSNVYVYSVPFLDCLCGKVFKPKPVIKLSLDVKVIQDVLAEQNYYPTRISWTKVSLFEAVSLNLKIFNDIFSYCAF